MRCPKCTNRDLVVIHLTISDEEIALYRCARCDERVWVTADGVLTTENVLERVRASR